MDEKIIRHITPARIKAEADAKIDAQRAKENDDPVLAVDAMRKFMNSRKTIPDINLKNLIAEDRY